MYTLTLGASAAAAADDEGDGDQEDIVVTGRPDPEWGQRMVAAVVPAPGATPTLAGLRPWVADRLGAAAAPRELLLLDAVPTLHTGKPDSRAVARRLTDDRPVDEGAP